MQVYDYSTNSIFFTRKDGTRYNLKLRGKVTIVDGNSGTGKTLLVSELKNLKKTGYGLTGIDLNNVSIITSSSDLILDESMLYIIDRADTILDDILCDKICTCLNARFLIFARSSYSLGVSPNHFGELIFSGNEVSIKYDFNEKWW